MFCVGLAFWLARKGWGVGFRGHWLRRRVRRWCGARVFSARNCTFYVGLAFSLAREGWGCRVRGRWLRQQVRLMAPSGVFGKDLLESTLLGAELARLRTVPINPQAAASVRWRGFGTDCRIFAYVREVGRCTFGCGFGEGFVRKGRGVKRRRRSWPGRDGLAARRDAALAPFRARPARPTYRLSTSRLLGPANRLSRPVPHRGHYSAAASSHLNRRLATHGLGGGGCRRELKLCLRVLSSRERVETW